MRIGTLGSSLILSGVLTGGIALASAAMAQTEAQSVPAAPAIQLAQNFGPQDRNPKGAGPQGNSRRGPDGGSHFNGGNGSGHGNWGGPDHDQDNGPGRGPYRGPHHGNAPGFGGPGPGHAHNAPGWDRPNNAYRRDYYPPRGYYAGPRIGDSGRYGRPFHWAPRHRLPPPPRGMEYRVVQDRVVMVDRTTLAIVSVLGLLSALN